jgi:hypothetical protein
MSFSRFGVQGFPNHNQNRKPQKSCFLTKKPQKTTEKAICMIKKQRTDKARGVTDKKLIFSHLSFISTISAARTNGSQVSHNGGA